MLVQKQSLLLAGLFFAGPLLADSYMAIGLGAVFPNRDITIEDNSTYDLFNPTAIGSSIFFLPDIRWKNELGVGADANLSIGHTLSNHFRIEGEFVYQYIPRETSGTYGWEELYSSTGVLYASQFDNSLNSEEMSLNMYALMANLFYDFNTNSAWTPFAGAGIGIAWIQSDSVTSNNTLHIVQTSPSLDESAPTQETTPELFGTAFAWQLKVGLNYAWTEQMSFEGVYRLFGTTDFEQKDGHIVTSPDVPAERANFKLPQSDIDGLLNNSVYIGFRYAFI